MLGPHSAASHCKNLTGLYTRGAKFIGERRNLLRTSPTYPHQPLRLRTLRRSRGRARRRGRGDRLGIGRFWRSSEGARNHLFIFEQQRSLVRGRRIPRAQGAGYEGGFACPSSPRGPRAFRRCSSAPIMNLDPHASWPGGLGFKDRVVDRKDIRGVLAHAISQGPSLIGPTCSKGCAPGVKYLTASSAASGPSPGAPPTG